MLRTIGPLDTVSCYVSLCLSLSIKQEREGPGTLPHMVPHWTKEKFTLDSFDDSLKDSTEDLQ